MGPFCTRHDHPGCARAHRGVLQVSDLGALSSFYLTGWPTGLQWRRYPLLLTFLSRRYRGCHDAASSTCHPLLTRRSKPALLLCPPLLSSLIRPHSPSPDSPLRAWLARRHGCRQTPRGPFISLDRLQRAASLVLESALDSALWPPARLLSLPPSAGEASAMAVILGIAGRLAPCTASRSAGRSEALPIHSFATTLLLPRHRLDN
ncbi:hypothetical protein CDD83_4499 [Cordyceps sp. RAO-2017]|nr:hypothetical protein CDD83_4499 [Cordyceps sp. RAO-2017]